MSAQAKKAKGKQIRDWHLNRRSGSDRFRENRGVRFPRLLDWILRCVTTKRGNSV